MVTLRIDIADLKHGQGFLLAVMDCQIRPVVSKIIAQKIKGAFEIQMGLCLGNVKQALSETTKALDEVTCSFAAGSTLSLAYIPDDEAVAHTAWLGDSPIIIAGKAYAKSD